MAGLLDFSKQESSTSSEQYFLRDYSDSNIPIQLMGESFVFSVVGIDFSFSYRLPVIEITCVVKIGSIRFYFLQKFEVLRNRELKFFFILNEAEMSEHVFNNPHSISDSGIGDMVPRLDSECKFSLSRKPRSHGRAFSILDKNLFRVNETLGIFHGYVICYAEHIVSF